MHKNRLMTRRRALWLSLASLAAMGAGCRAMSQQSQASDNLNRDFTVVGQASLRERAAAKGLIYGAAGGYPWILGTQADFAASFARECGILVPEGELKWANLRPNPDSFDFTNADWLFDFAHTHGMLFRGHTLVWHELLPWWFQGTVNSQKAKDVLLKHIATVVGHYAGKIHSWDVVNEAIDVTNGRSDSLRNTPWLQFLGPDYIDIAFRAAAEADPQALLVYNDNQMEYDLPDYEAKRVAVLKLLERLKSMGTPVQALGVQSHLDAAETHFNPKKLKAFLHDVADLGLKILITELDVNDHKLPLPDINVRDQIVAGAYEDYLSVVLDEPAVIAVLTWGLSDRYTWLSTINPRSDGASLRPLPLDAQLQRKLAWKAIARAFDHAPQR